MAEHQQDVNFTSTYNSWPMSSWRSRCPRQGCRHGDGDYRDLAVGVSEGSTEIWANRDLYCPKARSVRRPIFWARLARTGACPHEPEPVVRGGLPADGGSVPVPTCALRRAAHRPRDGLAAPVVGAARRVGRQGRLHLLPGQRSARHPGPRVPPQSVSADRRGSGYRAGGST